MLCVVTWQKHIEANNDCICRSKLHEMTIMSKSHRQACFFSVSFTSVTCVLERAGHVQGFLFTCSSGGMPFGAASRAGSFVTVLGVCCTGFIFSFLSTGSVGSGTLDIVQSFLCLEIYLDVWSACSSAVPLSFTYISFLSDLVIHGASSDSAGRFCTWGTRPTQLQRLKIDYSYFQIKLANI